MFKPNVSLKNTFHHPFHHSGTSVHPPCMTGKTKWTHIPTVDVPIQKIYESVEKLCSYVIEIVRKGWLQKAHICEKDVEFCSEFLYGLDLIGLGSFKSQENVGSKDCIYRIICYI